MLTRLCLLVALLGLPTLLVGQGTQAVQRAVLHLKIAEAERAVTALSSEAQQAFYRHHIRFVQTLALGRADLLSGFERYSDTELSKMETAGGAYGLAYRAEAYAERAVIHLLRKDRLAAFWDLSRAHALTETIAKEYPASQLYQRLQGLFLLAVSALPSSYQWMARQLGFEGDYARGAYLLTQADADPLLGEEVPLYRYFVAKHLDSDAQRAYNLLAGMQQAYPGSPLVAYLLGSHLLELRKAEQAIPHLERALAVQSGSNIQLPFFWHLLGRCYLFQGNYTKAADCFQSFLRRQGGSLLRQDAQFRLALCKLFLGAPATDGVFEAMWDEPTSGFDDDRAACLQALALQQTHFSDVDLKLYRARYHSDGGYFSQANRLLEEVSALPKLTEDQVLEVHYRRARIAHLQNRFADARHNYLLASVRKPIYNGWMLPYSLFYMGALSEREGRHIEALGYIQQALTYSDFAYEQGLEQKAKAARSRIRRYLRRGE